MKQVNAQTKLTTAEAVERYIQEGVQPLEWKLYPIESIESGKREAVIAMLNINDFEYGVLTSQVYEEATYSTVLGAKLMFWQIARAQEMFNEFKANQKEMPLLLISVPLKVLLSRTLKQEYTAFLNGLSKEFAQKICFLFNNEVLYAEAEDVTEALSAVREKGIHLGLEYFGEEYFAPLRLKNLKIEYVLFTTEFCESLTNGEQESVLLAEMAFKLGYKCIMQNRIGEAYQAFRRDDSIAEYFQIRGIGKTLGDFLERELIGDVLDGIPVSVIEQYGLETKDWRAMSEALRDVKLAAKSSERSERTEETVTVYVKSFEARLIQSEPELKENYKQIKSRLMEYEGVRSTMSWQYESFHIGRNATAKLSIRGKTLCLYLNLRPKEYTYTKYKVKAERSQKYKQTPCRYDITGPRKAKYALELIDDMYSKQNVMRQSEQPQVTVAEYEDTEALIERGLIKVKQTQANPILF